MICLTVVVAPADAQQSLTDYSATLTAAIGSYQATRDARPTADEAWIHALRQRVATHQAQTRGFTTSALPTLVAQAQATANALRQPLPTPRPPRTTATIRAEVRARFFPTPTPTPTDAGYSQDNPAPHGHALDTPDNWRITVLDTIPHYEQRVLAAGFHIPPEQLPPAGWHWLAIKLRFTNLGPVYPSIRDTIYDRQREMPTFHFEFVSASRQPQPERWCGPTYFDAQDLPDDMDRMPEAGFLMWRYVPTLGWRVVGREWLTTGHTDEGWTCRMIRERDTESLVMFYAGTLGGVAEGVPVWYRWWKL